MRWKIVFSLVFIFIVVGLLAVYWFPGEIEFITTPRNYNFSLIGEGSDMQFYPNLRYADSRISYKISDCNLQKKDDMLGAFNIIEGVTILNFYAVASDEDISVTCDDKQRFEGGMFIAGEGGPTNATQSGEFYVISHGKILLIRESKCERPNVAIHELLHALGFGHSLNKNNIMYNTSKCRQTIGDDIPKVINELYAIPGKADLILVNVSGFLDNIYLDTNFTIKNAGLVKSEDAKVVISTGSKKIKEIDVKPFEPGSGLKVSLTNILVTKFNIDELRYTIEYSGEELSKENNIVVLEALKK